MTSPSESGRELDLQPHPRILPMLGEIHLKQWQCVAELLDNSVDAFIGAQRAGKATHNPEVIVGVPSANRPDARLTVVDNGPGMDPTRLENAVRAGWSGNDPIENLGLFGMGFNIATARLGSVTQVWTTRRDDDVWHGVTIDFDELVRSRSFKAPLETRPKPDRQRSGTEVVVTRLKPDQREWFAQARNRTVLASELGRVYSAMLEEGGKPVRIRLRVNDVEVRGRRHCVWDANRVVESPIGPIAALRRFDVRLEDRNFCRRCWHWLSTDSRDCPQCGRSDEVVLRQRRIHGWLGVQRYLHERNFGIDFLRNGRKIEVANKELFQWAGEDGREEPEYPVDDPRDRGRIVGEVHLDHCRVHYTKDRFDRNDAAWEDMARAVRGEGPLRPRIAEQLGFRGENLTPLYVLYQGFRRSNPKTRRSPENLRLLLVPDNDRAQQMAERFYSGDPQFQSDEKWYALAMDADRQVVVEPPTTEDQPPEIFWGDQPAVPTPGAPSAPAVARRAIPSLSTEFVDDNTELRWSVQAFEAASNDTALAGAPWILQQPRAGSWEFLVDPRAEVFRSATLTPLDALLADLAHLAVDASRGRQRPAGFSQVLAGLRSRYALASRLDAATLSVQASAILNQIAKSLARNVPPADAAALFGSLPLDEQNAIWDRIVSRGQRRPDTVARFLEFAPRPTLRRFFEAHPELFMDGKYWDVPYDSLDFGREDVTAAVREQVRRTYVSLLTDAIWLAEEDAAALGDASRARLLRAALALEVLESEVTPGVAE
jgi:hypothetical protein